MFAVPPLTIPPTREAVSAEWLTHTLGLHYPGVEVTAARVDEFMGHKPNKARVHLHYNQAGQAAGLPATMIVKGSFPGYASKGAIVDFSNVAEVVSYRDALLELDVNCPHAYVAALEPEHGASGILLLEDLAPKQPVYFSAADTLRYQQAHAFVGLMASLHAQTWDSDKFRPGGRWGPDSPLGQNGALLYQNYFAKLLQLPDWDAIRRQPRGAALPRSITDQARLARAWPRLLDVCAACPRVLVHGDEHLGNLYLEGDGTPGCFDPFARPDSWVVGYTYFAVVTLDSVDRRQWERPLLQHYLQCLTRRGIAAPGFDEAWYAYRCASLLPLMVWIHNSSQWQPEWANTSNAMRAGLAVLDHDAFGLLGL